MLRLEELLPTHEKNGKMEASSIQAEVDDEKYEQGDEMMKRENFAPPEEEEEEALLLQPSEVGFVTEEAAGRPARLPKYQGREKA
ncbi:hypothetical protein RUM43_003630 [Polyplax serrata]|uniref:Uncharacterized protein n=1 Tax=Polyplax serrata TaxID=468196 RepID=A0AAN8S3A8_POLSC